MHLKCKSKLNLLIVTETASGRFLIVGCTCTHLCVWPDLSKTALGKLDPASLARTLRLSQTLNFKEL
jgi:lipoate synthase